ncbi:MAG: MarR family transcriptional regulator, partial [Actinomycetota bacterium]|nr:MarR family transcriptional regulator [Actinomycetota bacterium]
MANKGGEQPGREAWRLMAELMFSPQTQDRFHDACAAVDLSPPQLKALVSLEPGQAVAMSVLAKAWRCDASWVTGIVDGLEQQGFVRRRTPDADRRVKVVEITKVGEKAKAKVLDRLYEPPPSIAKLDDEEQRVLRDLIRKVREVP